MDLRRGARTFLLGLAVAFCLAAPVASGGPVALVLDDPAGDSGALPCSAATDILRLGADWAETGIELTYTFADLAVVDSPAALAQDLAGRCFWSYTDFVADIGGATFVDSVYIDHNANPAFETGWRFFLNDAGTPLVAKVEGNEIVVTLPYTVLGTPSVGDRFGDLRVQVSNAAEGMGLAYQTDWLPGDTEPCACWTYYGSL